jgi:predicted aspartyl protease
MRGRVVSGGREAVVPLAILGSDGSRVEVEAVIDTGFTGHLTLRADVVRPLALSGRGFVEVELADGSTAALGVDDARVLWRARERPVPGYEAEGGPLVGMSLLRGSRLTVDVEPGGEVVIEDLPGSER